MKKLIKHIKTKWYESRIAHCQEKIRDAEDAYATEYWFDVMWEYDVKLLAL